MDTAENPNTSLPSTNWTWKKVKMASPPGGDRSSASASSPRLRLRNPRKPLVITVTYAGGQECSWLIRYRGRIWRFAGHLALHDVLASLSDVSPQARR